MIKICMGEAMRPTRIVVFHQPVGCGAAMQHLFAVQDLGYRVNLNILGLNNRWAGRDLLCGGSSCETVQFRTRSSSAPVGTLILSISSGTEVIHIIRRPRRC